MFGVSFFFRCCCCCCWGREFEEEATRLKEEMGEREKGVPRSAVNKGS